jgi:hypothetical protein
MGNGCQIAVSQNGLISWRLTNKSRDIQADGLEAFVFLSDVMNSESFKTLMRGWYEASEHIHIWDATESGDVYG